MRRISVILTLFALVSVASLVHASGAAAGDFADDPCANAGGDNYLCPPATAGAPYSLDIKLKEPWPECTTLSVSSGALPPGLSMGTDGSIRGTPTAPGGYTFFVTVTWGSGNCYQAPSDRKFTINVSSQVVRAFVATSGLPDASMGQAYTAPALAMANGSASSWTLAGGTLPPGLTLNPNGVIAGTPTAAGPFSFTVQGNASPNSDTRTLSIFVVAPLELQTLTGKKPAATGLSAKAALNAPITTGVKAVGGRGPYAFASTGVLPAGLALDPANGAITGAGTVAGRFSPTITVTDATGAKASVPFTFTILPLLEFTKGKLLPAGRVDRLYSARVPIRGKDARVAQFALSGRIPPGIELDDTGRLRGTLLLPGVYRMRVFAFPANGAPISKFFTIRVRP